MSWYAKYGDAMCAAARKLGSGDDAVLVLNAAMEIQRLEEQVAAMRAHAPMTLDEVKAALEAWQDHRTTITDSVRPMLERHYQEWSAIVARCPHEWPPNEVGTQYCTVCGGEKR